MLAHRPRPVLAMAIQARPNLSMRRVGSQPEKYSTDPVVGRPWQRRCSRRSVSSQQPRCGPRAHTPSRWKPWLNAWLTTSSAITLACHAPARRNKPSAPPAASYTGCIFQRRRAASRHRNLRCRDDPTRHRSLDRFVPQGIPCETISIKPRLAKDVPTRPICGSASGIPVRRRQWPYDRLDRQRR